MKKYPLLIIIVATMILVSVPGIYNSVLNRNFTHPAAAVTIHAVKNDETETLVPKVIADTFGLHNGEVVIPDDVTAIIEEAGANRDLHNTVSDDAAPTEGSKGDEEADANGGETATDSGTGEDAEEAGNEEESDSDENSDNEEETDEADENKFPKEFTEVSDEYFADACFIGDSRVQGLGLYSDLPATNFGIVGLQLYKVFEKRVIDTGMGKATIPEMLAVEPKYGKIYLKFGINEIGWGNDDMFADYYYALIDYIKAVQPDAIIYIMSVIHVTAAEQASASIFNNDRINERNERIKEIAENEHVYYLDLNEVFTDENGCLPAEDSFDGIHIRSQSMYKWVDYLKTHAIE
ncbi:MAG: hypothetical protein K6G03_08460 [Lachnospiraceae bacterium]|nr:hypothetical protein [Lachnospiraceae bacterium]